MAARLRINAIEDAGEVGSGGRLGGGHVSVDVHRAWDCAVAPADAMPQASSERAGNAGKMFHHTDLLSFRYC